MLAIYRFTLLYVLTIGAICYAQDVVKVTDTRASIECKQWRFQPGLKIDQPPLEKDWANVNLRFLWTKDENLQYPKDCSWKSMYLRNLDSGWFESDINIPQAFAGQSIFLDCKGIETDAVLWIDGRKVCEIDGPDERIDITSHVVPGRKSTFRFWVTRWWAGISQNRKDDPLRDVALTKVGRHYFKNDQNLIRQAVQAGISESITLRAMPKASYIDNVFVQPSVRHKRLRLVVVTQSSVRLSGARIQTQVCEMDGSIEGLPKANVALTQAVLGECKQVIDIPWDNPTYWEVGEAYLYQLDIRITDLNGKVIDIHQPVRFGFREVWTQGNQIILNGHPLRLRMTYARCPSADAEGNVLPETEFWEDMGVNSGAIQPNTERWYVLDSLYPSDLQAQLKLADERGWAILMNAPSVAYPRDIILNGKGEAEYIKTLKRWLHAYDKQNNPSILLWWLSMNTTSNLNPEQLGQHSQSPQPAWYKKSEDLMKSMDPTRLVAHHHGGQTGDVEMTNLYLNFLPLQEREEFVSHWAKTGKKPWGSPEFGPPFMANCLKTPAPLFTEYSAIYLGDRAYQLETPAYVEELVKISKNQSFQEHTAFSANGFGDHILDQTAFGPLMHQFLKNTSRSFRTWGVGGGLYLWMMDQGFGMPPNIKIDGPWYRRFTYGDLSEQHIQDIKNGKADWMNTNYWAFKKNNQPLLVYLGGHEQRFTAKDHNYYSGQTVEKTICSVWDSVHPRQIQVNWHLTVADQVLEKGIENIKLGSWDIVKKPIRFMAPYVEKITDAILAIDVCDLSGKVIATDQMDLTLFPKIKSINKLHANWGIFDPKGLSTAMLSKLGIYPKPVKTKADLSGVNVLVIGREALAQGEVIPWSQSLIADGLRVLVLEQDVPSLESIGFQVQDVVPRYCFARVKSHPVLRNLPESSLINWRGEGTLLPKTSQGMKPWPHPHAPHWGNYGSVASVVIQTPQKGAFTPLIDCEFDLAYTPLLQWNQGRGQVYFCQLDLTDRVGLEPAADLVLANLVQYLDQEIDAKSVQSHRLIAQTDSKKIDMISKLGFELQVTTDATQKLDPQKDVLLIAAGELDQVDTSSLQTFVQAGGQVLVAPQSAKALNNSRHPWQMTIQPRKIANVSPESDMAILRGIGPQLLHFRSFMNVPAVVSLHGGKIACDGLLAELPVGKGRWIFCQYDPTQMMDDTANHRYTAVNAFRFYRQLLTNLGIANQQQLQRTLTESHRVASYEFVKAWQVYQDTPTIDTSVDMNNRHLGLGAALPVESSLDQSEPGQGFSWRLKTTDPSGFMDFSTLGTPKAAAKAGLAVTWIYSSQARQANFALSADWWLIFRVNGKAYLDHSADPRMPHSPYAGEFRITAPLKKGWNRLEIKVASGGGGFGFWCQVTDPGDLLVVPSLHVPPMMSLRSSDTPALLGEPMGMTGFYVLPTLEDYDPYAFRPW